MDDLVPGRNCEMKGKNGLFKRKKLCSVASIYQTSTPQKVEINILHIRRAKMALGFAQPLVGKCCIRVQLHVQFTITCTIYNYMYNLQLHVQFTITRTIYNYTYNLQLQCLALPQIKCLLFFTHIINSFIKSICIQVYSSILLFAYV
jgi:hypothetical protein